MASRDEILSSIRQRKLPPAEPPTLAGDWIRYPDPVQQFQTVLSSVGGQPLTAAGTDAVRAAILTLQPMSTARQTVCLVPGMADLGNLDLATVAEPSGLAAVDVAIVPGELGVAENAAVWVTDAAVRHRSLYFITQHLVLVVPADKIVDNLHQAYAQLRFDEPRYGVFISGPSKTADIEQSLVIGAHGPRSLTVIISNYQPTGPAPVSPTAASNLPVGY